MPWTAIALSAAVGGAGAVTLRYHPVFPATLLALLFAVVFWVEWLLRIQTARIVGHIRWQAEHFDKRLDEIAGQLAAVGDYGDTREADGMQAGIAIERYRGTSNLLPFHKRNHEG